VQGNEYEANQTTIDFEHFSLDLLLEFAAADLRQELAEAMEQTRKGESKSVNG
jgi:hypothetical protein